MPEFCFWGQVSLESLKGQFSISNVQTKSRVQSEVAGCFIDAFLILKVKFHVHLLDHVTGHST
jgi:hypothetical protein